MNRSCPGIWRVVAVFFLVYQARAQIMLDPSVLKFLDPATTFSADAEIILWTGEALPVKIAILGSLTRVEMDITKVRAGKSSDKVEAEWLKDMKKAGAAESVSIFNPERKCTLTVLPRLKAYLQTPIPEKVLAEMRQRPKAERRDLGEEKIGTNVCRKYTINFPVNREMDVWRTWKTPSATLWIAQDVAPCPLRMDVLDSVGRTNCIFFFKDIQTGKVDKNLFEPPRGFLKCKTMDALDKIIDNHFPKDGTQ